MPRGKELSPQLRSRLCELKSLGYGPKRIARIHPEVPLSTIKYTLRHETQRINNQSQPRSGAPKKLSEEQRDHIFDTVTHTNPHITTKDLLAEVDNTIKERALRLLLREMGRRKWLQRRRPLLTAEHAARRLAWAIRYRDLDWARVRWSDECSVQRGAGARPIYTFLSPKEQILERDIKPIRRHGVRQMFWALFGPSYRSGLIALDGRVTGAGIRDLYRAYLPDLIGPDDIFMQDNAPTHTARIVKAVLEELGIKVMIWPPYSPDLNPIENLWALMKAEIYRLYPELELAPDNQETRLQLTQAAKEAWHAIDQSIHQKLVDTMPHRVAAIIAACGWYTKY